jgi:hypothetical protein
LDTLVRGDSLEARADKLGTTSTVGIGWISKLQTNDLGAGEAVESIADELEATA